MIDHLQSVTPKLEIVRRGVAAFDQEVVELAAPSRPLERCDDVGSVESHREKYLKEGLHLPVGSGRCKRTHASVVMNVQGRRESMDRQGARTEMVWRLGEPLGSIVQDEPALGHEDT